jgi:hypothetical protein
MTRSFALAGALLLLAGGAALGAERVPYSAAEMQTLVGKGLSVSSSDLEGGRHFTGRVELAAGGRLSGTLSVRGQGQIALSGTWRLRGAQLCRTLAPVEPAEVCETWLKNGGAKEAVIQVNGQETSINRWQ